MSNKPLNPTYQAALDRAAEVIAAGGGPLELQGPSWQTSVARGLIAHLARQSGYACVLRSADERRATIVIERRDDEPLQTFARGAPKSEWRLAIEALDPGLFESFSTDEVKPDALRNIIQSVQRATGRRFTTQLIEGGNAMLVTRIDSLDEASASVRQAAMAELRHSRSKWPFARMELGESQTALGANIEAARSMAQYHRRRYGTEFVIHNAGDGVIITRTK